MARSRRLAKEYSTDKRAVNARHRRQRKRLYPRQKVADSLGVERHRIVSKLREKLGGEYRLVGYSSLSIPAHSVFLITRNIDYFFDYVSRNATNFEISEIRAFEFGVMLWHRAFTASGKPQHLDTVKRIDWIDNLDNPEIHPFYYVLNDEIRQRYTFVVVLATGPEASDILNDKELGWQDVNVPSNTFGVKGRLSWLGTPEERDDVIMKFFEYNAYSALEVNGFFLRTQIYYQEIIFAPHTPPKWTKNRGHIYRQPAAIYKFHIHKGIWRPLKIGFLDISSLPSIDKPKGYQCSHGIFYTMLGYDKVYSNDKVSFGVRMSRSS